MVFDSKFEHATLVTPDGVQTDAAVGVSDGTIAAVGTPSELGDARRVVDIDGQYLLPGVIDCHIHTRSPGYE